MCRRQSNTKSEQQSKAKQRIEHGWQVKYDETNYGRYKRFI
jgi:hypothetical protein